MILLDTHVAVWLATANKVLGSQSHKLILEAREENQLSVSAVSFWEIALLVSKDRLDLSRDPFRLRKEFLDTGVMELPLSGDIAMLAVGLEGLHADRFIVATAIAHGATLMTADRRLLRRRHSLRRQNAET